MQAQKSVHPAAPAGMQVQIPEGGMPATGVSDGGDVAASPGQAKSPLSKVKNKAKKLREKIKKVTSPASPTSPDLGHLNKQNKVEQRGNVSFASHPPQYQPDDVGGGTASHKNDEEDRLPQGLKQSNSNQLRSLAAMANSGAAGTEGVVHGGVPASTVAAGAYGSQSGGSLDSSPISPFKNDGPPGALQAAPTEYHYTPDDNISTGFGNANLPKEANPPNENKTELTSRAAAENAAFYKSWNDMASRPAVSPLNSKSKNGTLTHLSERVAPEDVNSGDMSGITGHPNDEQRMPEPSDQHQENTFSVAPAAANNNNLKSLRPVSSERFSPIHHISSGQTSPPERDMNVSYPDDIVKPNPEFGRTSSPMRKKIAVINESLPAETKADAGLSSEGYSSLKEILDKAVPENAPLTFDKDKTRNAEVSSASSKLGIVTNGGKTSDVDVSANSTTAGGGNAGYLDVSDEEDEGQLPKHLGMLDHDGKERAQMKEESRGKWAEDKFNSSKKAEIDDESDGSESVNTTNAMSSRYQKHGSQYSEGTEDEYFDPNYVSDNQFQEGFALGSGEADKELLDGTLAGATLGKLSELTGAVANKLGLANEAGTDASSGEGMQEANAINGAEHLNGLKHENRDGEEAGNAEEESKSSDDHQQQTVGTLQNLKNVVAAKLGYGGLTPERTADDLPRDVTSEAQPSASTLEEELPASEGGKIVEEEEESNVTEQPQTVGTLQGLKNVVASKLGYGRPMQDHATAEDRPRDASVDEKSSSSSPASPLEAERPLSPREAAEEAKNGSSPSSSSYAQKLFNTAAAAKDYLWSPKGNSANHPLGGADGSENLNNAQVERPASVV